MNYPKKIVIDVPLLKLSHTFINSDFQNKPIKTKQMTTKKNTPKSETNKKQTTTPKKKAAVKKNVDYQKSHMQHNKPKALPLKFQHLFSPYPPTMSSLKTRDLE